MGIAIYNNTFIDMPFPRAAYKLLLDEEPNLDDLAQWQPEIAKSFTDMLNYEASANGGALLEDVLCRSFTTDVEQFGQKTEMELIPGGKDILVTKDNREEFVRLFIEFEFKK